MSSPAVADLDGNKGSPNVAIDNGNRPNDNKTSADKIDTPTQKAANKSATVAADAAAPRKSNNFLLPPPLEHPFARSVFPDNSLVREAQINAAKEARRLNTNCCFCCCILQTKHAVYLAASVGLALNLFGFLFYALQEQQLANGLPSLCSALLYLSALVAHRRRHAPLFLPFLVLAALVNLFWAFVCLYLVALIIFVPDWCLQLVRAYFQWDEFGQLLLANQGSERDEDQWLRDRVRLLLGISLSLGLVYLLVEAWLWWIIFRGYRAAQVRRSGQWLKDMRNNIRHVSIY